MKRSQKIHGTKSVGPRFYVFRRPFGNESFVSKMAERFGRYWTRERLRREQGRAAAATKPADQRVAQSLRFFKLCGPSLPALADRLGKAVQFGFREDSPIRKEPTGDEEETIRQYETAQARHDTDYNPTSSIKRAAEFEKPKLCATRSNDFARRGPKSRLDAGATQ